MEQIWLAHMKWLNKKGEIIMKVWELEEGKDYIRHCHQTLRRKEVILLTENR